MFLTPKRACRVSFSTVMGKEGRDLKGKEKYIGGRSGQIQKMKVPKAVSVLILFVFAVLAKISLFYLFFHRPTTAGSNGILTPSQHQQQRLSCSNTELAPPSSPTPLGSSSTTATFVPHHKSPRLQDFRRLLSIETRQVFVTHLINCLKDDLSLLLFFAAGPSPERLAPPWQRRTERGAPITLGWW